MSDFKLVSLALVNQNNTVLYMSFLSYIFTNPLCCVQTILGGEGWGRGGGGVGEGWGRGGGGVGGGGGVREGGLGMKPTSAQHSIEVYLNDGFTNNKYQMMNKGLG